MKVAIFTDTFLPQTNGVVTTICNSIKGLTKKGVEVIVFAPGETTYMDTYEGAKIFFFKSRHLPFYPGYLLVKPEELIVKVLTLLEMETPDIYHVHSPFIMGVAGAHYARKFKKPLIGTFHTLLEEYAGHFVKGQFKEIMKEVIGKPSWLLFREFFNMCGCTVAPTKEAVNLLKSHNFKNLKVLPGAIDFEKLKKGSKGSVKKDLNIPKDKKVLLFLGRISYEKRLDVLLKAMQKIDNAYLLVVGGGPQLSHYKKMARSLKLNNVKFTGFVPNKSLYYKACDIFVSPSDSETMGMTFIEAMFFNKPCIGTNKLGSNEMINHGVNGLKFKAGDVDDLVEKINELVNDSKYMEKLGKNAVKSTKEFTIDNITKRTIDIYQKTKPKAWKYELKDLNKNLMNIQKQLKQSF